MGRKGRIERAFDERGIEAAPSTIQTIGRSLFGEIRGLGRTGADGTDGLLAVSAEGAVLWEAAGETIHSIDLGAYSSVRRDEGTVVLTGDEVVAIPVRPADAERGGQRLDLFRHFGITEAGSVSVNTIRARLEELNPQLTRLKVDRVVAALARELARGESIDAALPAKRVPATMDAQGVVIATPDRLLHIEATPTGDHAESRPGASRP